MSCTIYCFSEPGNCCYQLQLARQLLLSTAVSQATAAINCS